MYKCKHCNGKGVTEDFTKLIDAKTGIPWHKTKICVFCLGEGEYDWIENIRGKDRRNAGSIIQKHWSTVWCEDEEEDEQY